MSESVQKYIKGVAPQLPLLYYRKNAPHLHLPVKMHYLTNDEYEKINHEVRMMKAYEKEQQVGLLKYLKKYVIRTKHEQLVREIKMI